MNMQAEAIKETVFRKKIFNDQEHFLLAAQMNVFFITF